MKSIEKEIMVDRRCLGKKLLLFLMMLFVLLLVPACGSDNDGADDGLKVKKLAEEIKSADGFHLKYYDVVDEKQADSPVEFYIQGDNMYIKMTLDGKETVAVMNHDNVTVTDNSTGKQTTEKYEGDWETLKSGLSVYATLFDNIAKLDDDKFTVGTVKVSGMEYDSESLEYDGAKTEFAFDDDGKLAYWIYIKDDNSTTIKIEVIDGSVPDDIFNIGTNDDDKKDTGNDTKKKSSDEVQYVTSSDGGFSFETETYAKVNVKDKYVDVYLDKENTVPYFNCYAMTVTEGNSADKHIDNTIKAVKEKQQNKLTGEPEKVSISVNGEKIPGFKYSYSTDDGSAVVVSENYVVWGSETFYSWGSAYMKGDNVTPSEMYAAMKSFKEE